MINTSLFSGEVREAKLNKSCEALWAMEQYIDVVARVNAVGQASPRNGRERGGRSVSEKTDGLCTADVQLLNVSDEQMEFQLLKSLIFQRFIKLRGSSAIPERRGFGRVRNIRSGRAHARQGAVWIVDYRVFRQLRFQLSLTRSLPFFKQISS